jgi:pentatricopeptide repeat protein
MFDTETMAELCVKQGLVDQAIAVFQRMASASEDPAARQRYQERIAALERQPGHVPLETPGLRVQTRQGEVGEIDIEWRLPTDTAAPALQLLVLRRTPQGIEAAPRTIPLTSPQGRTQVAVADLHSVRAAAGRLVGEAFVPIVRLAPPSPTGV